MNEIVQEFLKVRNQIKLYHWKTKSYSRHKATDQFVSDIDEKIDSFIEKLSGSRNLRIKDNFQLEFKTLNDSNVITYINKFKKWLKNTLPTLLHQDETDLFNLRDEIIGEVDQLLYLFELD
jgi:hypothetical protein